MSGTVERFDNRFTRSILAASALQLSNKTKIPEKCLCFSLIRTSKACVQSGRQLVELTFLCRSHPEMIKRLMEQEIPEVYDGTVEIMSVARQAGTQS